MPLAINVAPIAYASIVSTKLQAVYNNAAAGSQFQWFAGTLENGRLAEFGISKGSYQWYGDWGTGLQQCTRSNLGEALNAFDLGPS